MEYLVGIIVALLGGVVYFKKKADSNAVDAKLAETKGKDSVLKEQQEAVVDAIKEIDEGIEKLKKQQEDERQKRENMTLKERAEAAKKRYGK